MARCAAKSSAGLPSSRNWWKRSKVRWLVGDVLRPRPVRIDDVQPVEMREFGGDAAEIVPDAGEDRLDLVRRFLREGRDELFARRCGAPGATGRPCASRRTPCGPCACGRPARSVLIAPTKACPSIASPAALRNRRRADGKASRRAHQKRDDDLAEHLPAFEPRKPLLEFGERAPRCRSPAACRPPSWRGSRGCCASRRRTSR